MLDMTSPRLIEALTGLSPLMRESLSHLLISPEEVEVECVPAFQDLKPIQGPLSRRVGIARQIEEVRASGLWGDVTSDPDGALIRVQLWGGKGQREAWQRRLELAGRDEATRALLVAGSEVKLATWRRKRAVEVLDHHIRQADGHTGSRSDLIDLAQVARGTVYAALKATPEEAAATAREIELERELEAHAEQETPRTEVSQPVDEPAPALVRLPVGRTKPCAVCGTPATMLLQGVPVHAGECRRLLLERGAARPVAPDSSASSTRSSAPPRAQEEPPAAQPKRRPKTAAPRPKGRGRFRCIAATLDGSNLYLPDGEILPWEASTIADLAMLTKELKLGWGGGKKNLPDPGELWLYEDALTRLGLPVELGIDYRLQEKERLEQEAQIWASIMELPAVADALADGWELSQGRMGQRTRVSHPDLLPGGAQIVAVPWFTTYMQDYDLFLDAEAQEDEDGLLPIVSPAEMAHRLQSWVEWVGVAYRITPGATGLALIDHTRPPRNPGEDIDSQTPIAVVRNEPGEFPSFLRDKNDTRVRQIERNFSWWRTWESLQDKPRYVHSYDHHSHYLNPWHNVDLGIEGLVHLEGSDAHWDGSEKAAYFRVGKWSIQDWSVPDPLNAVGGFVDNDTVWVTAHTLRQLEKYVPGFTETLTFHESWTWERQARYLSKAAEILKTARSEAEAPVAKTVKSLYAMTTTKISSPKMRPNHHLFRPDWRDQVVAASRSAIVATLVDARNRSGITPLVVDRDTIIYGSDDPDPASAWPGQPDKLNNPSGGWRPTGSALLEEWGPDALEKTIGAWKYDAHMKKLSEPGDVK